jgi:hypothetical protein
MIIFGNMVDDSMKVYLNLKRYDCPIRYKNEVAK